MRNTLDFEAWKDSVDELQDTLKTISLDPKFRENLGEEFVEKVGSWNDKIKKNRRIPFTIAVCGEFKRGKSSLINALLGETVAPVNVTPETVTINTIRYGEHRNEAVLSNGMCLLLGDDELKRAKLNPIIEQHDGKITHLTLYRPIDILKDICIVDTPGLNETSGKIEKLTYEAVSSADAVIYMFVPNSPLSMTEQLFLRSYVLPRKGLDLFLVCNKMDTLDVEEQQTFRTWMNGKLQDLLGNEKKYYVSSLDERCRQLGKKRPNPETEAHLEEEFEELRQELHRLIEERSFMAMPNRVMQIMQSMKQDVFGHLNILEQGAEMDAESLVQKERDVQNLCSALSEKEQTMTAQIRKITEESAGEAKKTLQRALFMIRQDAGTLTDISREDLNRFYPFFCMEKIQEVSDKCTEACIAKIMSLFMELGEEEALAVLDQPTDLTIDVQMHINNRTWTKGDNLGYVAGKVKLGILSYVIDGIAGSMRNKELQGKTANVLQDSVNELDRMGERLPQMSDGLYDELGKRYCTQLSRFYQEKTVAVQDELKMAKEIAALGAKKRTAIQGSVKQVREKIIGCGL